MNHPVDAGKMDCRHAPVEPVVATRSVCKDCGASIEGRSCMACDGMGRTYITEARCYVCRGTGIDRWEVAK